MTESKITIPENMELVKISDIEYKIVEKKKELPKSWKEFCERYPIKEEYWVDSDSTIANTKDAVGRSRTEYWANLLPNKEYAEAILALCQLIQLRDCYRQGWKPDWTVSSTKFSISFVSNNCEGVLNTTCANMFSFKTAELRNEFYNNFKDLIEKTKPLFM